MKYVTLFWMIFDPLPPPCHKLSQILDPPPPPLKVCHTSEQKVKYREWETALNNYNRYYYILYNNKRPYSILGVSNKLWNIPIQV